MSMLTPPGMGGKYRITGNQYPRMRRPRSRRRAVLFSVATVALLGLMGWGTVQLVGVFTGSGRAAGANAAGAHCSPGTTAGGVPLDLPKPSAITVNVYNATPRTGLAKATADELKKRGFTIGKVGNASAQYDKKIKGAGVLLGGPKAQSALKVLATQLSAGQPKTDPSRSGSADVDLIIGSSFGSLDPQESAARALAALSHPSPAPSASKRC